MKKEKRKFKIESLSRRRACSEVEVLLNQQHSGTKTKNQNWKKAKCNKIANIL